MLYFMLLVARSNMVTCEHITELLGHRDEAKMHRRMSIKNVYAYEF